MKKQQLAVFICLGICALAGTARAESACETVSTHLLDALDEGDYAGATADFDANIKAKLSADKLGQIWPAVVQQFGERGARETPAVNAVGELTVVLTPLHYGQSMIDAKVSCSADGKIASFLIQPHR
jgi:hypothetical protein